jgi:hypothetical protein
MRGHDCRSNAESDKAWEVTASDGLADESGEIYYADFDPTIGSEINKRRPVITILLSRGYT